MSTTTVVSTQRGCCRFYAAWLTRCRVFGRQTLRDSEAYCRYLWCRLLMRLAIESAPSCDAMLLRRVIGAVGIIPLLAFVAQHDVLSWPSVVASCHGPVVDDFYVGRRLHEPWIGAVVAEQEAPHRPMFGQVIKARGARLATPIHF